MRGDVYFGPKLWVLPAHSDGDSMVAHGGSDHGDGRLAWCVIFGRIWKQREQDQSRVRL